MRYTVRADPSLWPNPRDRVLKSWLATVGGPTGPTAGHVALCHLEPANPWWPLAVYAAHGLPVELNHYHVERAYRGNGLGGRLLKTALRWAGRQGYPVLCCPQPYGRGKPPLPALLALYTAHGFTPCAKDIYIWYPPND